MIFLWKIINLLRNEKTFENSGGASLKEAKYIILSDATTSIPEKILKKLEVEVIPMQFNIGKNFYLRYSDDREIKPETAFERLRKGERGGGSHITISTYLNILRPYLEEGNDILLVTCTSSYSVNFSKAFVAANRLLGEFPERTIRVLDTFSLTSGTDLLLTHLAYNRLLGKSLEENYQEVYEEVSHLRTYFLLEGTKYLESKSFFDGFAEAIRKVLLKNVPIFEINEFGKQQYLKALPTIAKAEDSLVKKMSEELKDQKLEIYLEYDPTSKRGILPLEKKIKKAFPNATLVKVKFNPLVALYLGPDIISISYLSKKRNLKRPI